MFKKFSVFKLKINRWYLLKLNLSYLILVMIFVIVVASTLYIKSYNIIREEVGESVNDIVMDNSYMIAEIMESVKKAYFEEIAMGSLFLDFIEDNYLEYKSYDDAKGVQDVINVCNGVIQANKYIESIYIYHENTGKILANDSHIWDYEKMNYKEWINQQFDNGMPVFTASIQKDNSIPPVEKPFYSYIGGFPNLRGNDRVLINFNVNAINARLSKVGLRDSGFIFVTDQNGRILFHRDSKKLLTMCKVEYGDVNILENSSGQIIDELDHKQVMIIYNTISGLKWKVVALVPLNEIYNPILIVRNITYITCLFSLAIAVMFSLLLSQRIYEPLNDLVAAMKKVETGDFEVEVVHRRKDEFGYLYDRFNVMLKNIRMLITNTYKLELMNKESQLKTLQTQINPHFLYNTLNTLFCMAEAEGNSKLSSMIYKLSEYYKICLSEGDEEIPVGEVLRQLVYYYEIEKVKRPGKLELVIEVEPEMYHCKMLKMLLQPLVENAFIHGFDPLKKILKVHLRGTLEKGVMRFFIIDNGRGIKPEKLEQIKNSIAGTDTGGKNFALRNISSRIRLHYGERYGMEIFSELNSGTRVVITLPSGGEPGIGVSYAKEDAEGGTDFVQADGRR
jgi:two-component system sensor histidine kinase YesM